MIITRTPFRISFVGGGSDMEAFYSRHQGAVLSTSINKYMYISTHKFFFPDQIRVKYSQTETVDKLKDLKHPLLREAMLKTEVKGGIEISSIADIPAGTGMGSSSSFTVGTLHNLYAVKRRYVTHETLAHEACEIEIEKLGEPIGKQDQYAAAFGGLNVIYFNPDGSVRVDPLYIKNEVYQQLQRNLVMFYVGNQRKASDILTEQKKKASQAEQFHTLKSMVYLVSDLRDSLYKEKLDDFGRILHENWILKQKLASQISNSEIEKIYKAGIQHGASGGKLLGAGGGGFMLFYCEEKKQQKLFDNLKPLRKFDFAFDREGSKLIYYADEEF
ncbi:MAG: GHMP kinase [Bacteroidales bacterium]|nr:GHMP kinase [Bacteroidales bacterium]MBN2763753.1 GHMP kinase [Bacteroidales bacterium]